MRVRRCPFSACTIRIRRSDAPYPLRPLRGASNERVHHIPAIDQKIARDGNIHRAIRLFGRLEGDGYRGPYMLTFGNREQKIAGRDYLLSKAQLPSGA